MFAGPLPVHALLFAAYPTLFLFSHNLSIAVPRDALPPLVISVTAALFATAVLTLVTRDLRRSALVVSALVFVVFGYGHVLTATESLGMGVRPTHAVLAVTVGLAVSGAIWLRGNLPAVTRALNLASVVMVAVTLVSIGPHEIDRARGISLAGSSPGTAGTSTVVPGAPAAGAGEFGRDIYYLVFDRYGSQRSLELNYGIEDPGLFDWLREHGFYVADDSHANYVKTSLSLAATLNLDYLDDVAERMGPSSDDHEPIFEMFQEHEVGAFLKGIGYEYIHIGSWYQQTRTSRLADINTSDESLTDFSASLFDTSILPLIAPAVVEDGPVTDRERAYAASVEQLRQLRHVAERPGPQFVFAHVLLPHPPYVFDATGAFVEKERGDENAKFAAQLRYTNDQIISILEPLLAQPEATRPIVVLQADEGPYPRRYARDTNGFDWSTATTRELETKFGILNAFHLPDVGDERLYPTISSVNTFRLILDEYFGAELPLLPDRTYSSRGTNRPYQLTEITDRLPSLQ